MPLQLRRMRPDTAIAVGPAASVARRAGNAGVNTSKKELEDDDNVEDDDEEDSEKEAADLFLFADRRSFRLRSERRQGRGFVSL